MKIKNISILTTALMLAALGCTNTDTAFKSGSLKLFLTDGPGEYQQVNIDLAEIKVIVDDSIIGIPCNPGVYNLLDFANGKDTLIAEADVPEGTLSQIRLVLGDNNSLMLDSMVYDMKTPSAQESGLKLNVHQDIRHGEAYAYTIDFNAHKSVVRKGNGGFNLKPVIRVYSNILTGAVHGIISPPEADSVINLVRGNDTLSTSSDTGGNYLFDGLQEATYGLNVFGSGSMGDTSLTGIQVFSGQTTEIDTIFLKQAD